MNDRTTTISGLIKLVRNFRDERGWKKYHTPRNLATSIVLEASELLEHFQWDLKALSASQVRKDKDRIGEIKNEMADVIVYCLFLADVLGVDLSDAVINKLEHNRKKYSTKYFNSKGQDIKHYKKIKAKYRAGK